MDVDDHKLNLTKIIELLSSCGSIQDIMVNSLIRFHEKNKIVCGKYFYEIYIHLNKNDNIFEYRKASFHFLKQSELSHEEIGKILGLLNNMANVKYKDVFAGSFLALVRLYSKQPYRYLYLSVIIDYGGNTRLSHQTALIVDLHHGRFLFYEPYGKYEKYGASYRLAVLDFLRQYKFPAKFYTGDQLNYDTWHHYFGMPMGIQQMLMHSHNELKTQYVVDKDTLMKALQEKCPVNYAELAKILENGKDLPAHKDDFTFDTLEIMGYFVNNSLEVQNKQDMIELEKMALELYFKYNSKTCVTITLVEMHYFFTNLVMLSRQQQASALAAYYADFKTNRNHKLVHELDMYIKTALNSEYVYKWTTHPIGAMCDMIDHVRG